MSNEDAKRTKWYEGVTSCRWLVLMIGSPGWVFDIFESR
jgi:hypothetical protein